MGVLGAEGARPSSSSTVSTATSSRRLRTRRTRRSSPSSMRPPSMRWAGRTSSPCTCSSGSSSSARSPRSPGCSIGMHRRGFSGRRSCSCSWCRASASGCWRPRPTSCWTSSSSSPPCSWSSGSATGTVGGSRRRQCCSPAPRTRSAKGSLLAACVLAAAFVFSRPRQWRTARRLHPSSWLSRSRSRGGSGRAGTTSPRRRRRRRSAAGVLSGALDLSFDVLYSNGRWSVLPFVATIAARCGCGLGRSASGRFRRHSLRLLFFAGGVWSTAGFAELAISADESREPDRPLHGIDHLPRGRRRAAPAGSVWRRTRSPERVRIRLARRGDRRRPSGRLSRSSSAPTGRTSPRPTTASGRLRPARPTHSTSSSVAATRPARPNELLERVRAVGYVDAEVRAGRDADGGRSCTTGSPRTRRARALSPRPVVRASRHGSRSNRRSRLARAVP